MAYSALTLRNFRSYAEHSVQFGAGVNIIVGANGSGKTNLLEAVYVLSNGSSFRGAERELIRKGETFFRVVGVYNGAERTAACQITPAGSIEKQFTHDGAKKARMTHAMRVPVVLFEPDHLRLLRESPSHRREYIDTLLTKLQPDFAWVKHRFERVLAQRNNILKKRLPPRTRDDQLFAWDIAFVELAADINKRRRALVQACAEHISAVYSAIADKHQPVTIQYESSVQASDYQAELLRLLQQNITHDSDRGFTTTGPHRDDISFALNGARAAATASRGEVRTLLLALKIIELRMMHEQYGTPPLLLLDDVFSELDTSRRTALARLASEYQTLITTTDADTIAAHFNGDYTILHTSAY